MDTPNFLLTWLSAKHLGQGVFGKLDKSFLILCWFGHVIWFIKSDLTLLLTLTHLLVKLFYLTFKAKKYPRLSPPTLGQFFGRFPNSAVFYRSHNDCSLCCT